MLKKAKLKSLTAILLSLGIFSVGVSMLIFMPALANFTQNHIYASASNIPGQNIATIPQPQHLPQIQIESLNISPPQFTSPAVIAEDFDSGQILYQKNIHQRRLPASTTKIMTALVAIDYYKSSDILAVSDKDIVGGSSMGLTPGEKLSFRSLLYGMLLNSGNDAAFTIAENYPGGVSNFVAQMNLKAQGLGLYDTHFDNPAGFDSPGQYTSAYDLAKIGITAASDPEIAKVVATEETEVTSIDKSKDFLLKNLNQLLNKEGVIGFKTGTTPEAGENFVGLVERNNHKVLTVVLGSEDRFADTASLMDWTYKNYVWRMSYQ